MRPLLWDLRALLSSRALRTRHSLGALRRTSRLKAWVVLLLGGLLLLGLFAIFREGFSFLHRHDEIRDSVYGVAFPLFFLALGVMLTISNAILAYGAFYRGREAAFLRTTPARPEHVFCAQFLEMLGYSSWAFLILTAPLLAAYASVEGLGAGFLGGTAVLCAAYILIPAGLGALLAMATALVGPRRGPSRRLLAFGGLAVAGGGILLFRQTLHWKRSQGDLDPAWIHSFLERVSFANHPLLPSHWMAEAMQDLATGRWADLVYQACSIVSTAAVLFAAAYALAALTHRRAGLRATEGTGGSRQGAGPWMDRLTGFPLRTLFGRQGGELLLKDLKGFLRDPGQWTQALVFFGVLGIYFLNLRSLPYAISEASWMNLVAFLNLSATCLTLATFTSRFVFPLVSLEGRRFWILGLFPMSRGALLGSKFWFSFVGGLLVTGFLVGLSDTMLQVPRGMALLHAYAVVVICAGLSGLAVGLGAAFPDLKEESAARIVSSFGGTLNLILSLGYLIVVILLVAVPCHLHYARATLNVPDFRRLLWLCVAGMGVLGAAAVWVPLRMGRRAFERMDL